MNLLTEAGSRKALEYVRLLQAACRMAYRHSSDSEMVRLNTMMRHLAKLADALTDWAGAWEAAK